MSLHRSTRAPKTASRKTNEASLRGDTQTSKNPIPASCPGKLDMDEAALRKLTRAELQKLAKENKVKANAKSSVIIEELMKLCKVVPLHQDEENEEPVRKKSRTSLDDQRHSVSPRGAKKEGPPIAQTVDVTMDTSPDHITMEEGSPKPMLTTPDTPPTTTARNVADVAVENSAGTSQGPPLVPESREAPEDDISDPGSDLSHASKNFGLYHSPVSSRAGTPPLEESRMLERAVKIMNQITADDQRILIQIAALRERAAMLKEQAQKVRDVVRAEHGRRVRLETYFTYWREIAPEWPKEWIEGAEEDKKGTVAAAHPARVDQPGEGVHRMPSPQSSASGLRAAKRKSCT